MYVAKQYPIEEPKEYMKRNVRTVKVSKLRKKIRDWGVISIKKDN